MLKSFQLQLARWGQGLIRGAVQGGALAVKAWAGVAVISPVAKAVGFHDVQMTVQSGLAVFVFGVLWEMVNYLATHPLPEIDPPSPGSGGASPNSQGPIANSQ